MENRKKISDSYKNENTYSEHKNNALLFSKKFTNTGNQEFWAPSSLVHLQFYHRYKKRITDISPI